MIQSKCQSFEAEQNNSSLQQMILLLKNDYENQCKAYSEIHTIVTKKNKDFTKPGAPHPKATDFTKLFDLKHTELTPRCHKLILDTPNEKSLINETAYTIHGCVIEMNGGTMNSAFKNNTLEQSLKEMTIQFSTPQLLEKLIQYLYGKPIAIETADQAVELYSFADKWNLEPLKKQLMPITWEHSLQYKAHPPTISFSYAYSLTEVIKRYESARKGLQQQYNLYLKPIAESHFPTAKSETKEDK
jgi:hypothetical protein